MHMSDRPRTELDAHSVQSSVADVWYLKDIAFGSRPVKIITQNFNGPCSFIAICNILLLRGQIEILPHDRTTVSYEFLSQLVGEYLLLNCPDIDISAALSIMPSTTRGLDLNPQFTSITAFSPASDAGELDLFARAGIPLVHGWVVDPESPEAAVMSHIRDYDTAVTLIADADYLTHGKLLGGEEREGVAEAEAEAQPEVEAEPSWVAGSTAGTLAGAHSDEDRRKIEQAIVAQQFLDATKSQLTYHGLFQLASTLQPGSLVALFRNAHLSVVYRLPGRDSNAVAPLPDGGPSASSSASATHTTVDADAPADHAHAHDSALYALVTDDVFLHEPSIIWERLEDVDGGWSTFCDADFHRAVPVGGDVAGQTAEGAMRRLEVDPDDQALAEQLQAEEDAHARELYQRRQEALQQQQRQGDAENEGSGAKAAGSTPTTVKAAVERRLKGEGKAKGAGKRKVKECVVM